MPMATSRQSLRSHSKKAQNITKPPPVSPDLKQRSKLTSSPPKTPINYSSCEEYSEDEVGFDETDKCASKSPSIYPNISQEKVKNISIDSCNLSQISNSTENIKPTDADLTPLIKSRKSTTPKSPTNTNRTHLVDNYEKVLPKRHTGIMPVMYIGFACLCIFSLFAILYFYNKQKVEYMELSKERNITHIYNDILNELKILHKRLELTRDTWLKVRSQLDSMMVPNPLQPAVLLVVIPKGAERTAICFTHLLTEAIQIAFGDGRSILYDIKSSANLRPSQVKMELDDALSALSDHHSAVVHNLEHLSGEAALILHGYCDNDNAPHKQALILFTLGVDQPFNTLKMHTLDMIVDNILSENWGGINKPNAIRSEDLSAIISRIATSPVLINPEPNDVLNDLCSI